MNEMERSWVYFVQRPDGDIKIGTIVKYFFSQRMWALWKKNGSIRVLGVIDGGREKEAEMHNLFHEQRRFYFRPLKYRTAKYYTEYFEPSEGLIQFIKENSVDLKTLLPQGGVNTFKHDYFGFKDA